MVTTERPNLRSQVNNAERISQFYDPSWNRSRFWRGMVVKRVD